MWWSVSTGHHRPAHYSANHGDHGASHHHHQRADLDLDQHVDQHVDHQHVEHHHQRTSAHGCADHQRQGHHHHRQDSSAT